MGGGDGEAAAQRAAPALGGAADRQHRARRRGPSRRRCAPRPRRAPSRSARTGEDSKISTPRGQQPLAQAERQPRRLHRRRRRGEGAAAEGRRGAALGDLVRARAAAASSGHARARGRRATASLPDAVVGRRRSRPAGSRRGGTRRRPPAASQKSPIPSTAVLGGAGDRQRRLVPPALAHARQREPHRVAEAAVAAARPVPADARPRAGRPAPRAPAASRARRPTSRCSRRRRRPRRPRARRPAAAAGSTVARLLEPVAVCACAPSPPRESSSEPAESGGRRLGSMADRGQDSTPYVDALLAYSELRPRAASRSPATRAAPAPTRRCASWSARSACATTSPRSPRGSTSAPNRPRSSRRSSSPPRPGARARTWFLINGASQGNHATCMALAHGGNRVVVQRNVHSSVIDGLVLSGMRPTFVAPELDPELGIAHGLTPGLAGGGARRDARARSRRWSSPPPTSAPAPTSPRLAEVAHSRGVPLVVDEAWGAHLHFHPDLPADALAAGADLVTSSTHKIVGSLTQAAMLHLGRGGRIDARDRRPLRQPGRNDQPQRPALRLARRRPAPGLRPRRGAARRDAGGDRRDPRGGSSEIPGLDVLDERHGRPARDRRLGPAAARRSTCAAPAPPATGSGKAAFHVERHRPRALLRERRRRDLRRSASRPRPAGERLVAACARRSASWRQTPGAPDEKLAPPPPWGELVLTPREAFLGPQEVVPFDAAAGRDRRRGAGRLPARASPTSSPASGSPPRRSTTSARASPTAATSAAAATAS